MTNSLTGVASAAAFLFDMDGTLLGSYMRLDRMEASKLIRAAIVRLYTRSTGDLGVFCSRVFSGPHRSVEKCVRDVCDVSTLSY